MGSVVRNEKLNGFPGQFWNLNLENHRSQGIWILEFLSCKWLSILNIRFIIHYEYTSFQIDLKRTFLKNFQSTSKLNIIFFFANGDNLIKNYKNKYFFSLLLHTMKLHFPKTLGNSHNCPNECRLQLINFWFCSCPIPYIHLTQTQSKSNSLEQLSRHPCTHNIAHHGIVTCSEWSTLHCASFLDSFIYKRQHRLNF